MLLGLWNKNLQFNEDLKRATIEHGLELKCAVIVWECCGNGAVEKIKLRTKSVLLRALDTTEMRDRV